MDYIPDSDESYYSFISRGKKNILKIVGFTPIEKDGKKYYNWGFGDLVKYETTGFNVDDKTDSNNGDVKRVFYTVASALSAFFETNPGVTVHLKGSNQQRMNIYTKIIARHWADIDTIYDVRGFINGQIEPFQETVEFDYLLISKKKT
ncbi:MAG TPA: hypothetical protein VIU12_15090 [Chryseolinea sp.]